MKSEVRGMRIYWFIENGISIYATALYDFFYQLSTTVFGST